MTPSLAAGLVFLAGILLSGCSPEYQELAESLDAETPSLRMEQVVVVSVEDGYERFRIEAEELAEFDSAFRRVLENAEFFEYADDGGVSASGRAKRISFDTRSDDAVLEGGINFTSTEDDTSVTAEYLEWNDRERRLTGSESGEVLLESENGTRIRGSGFSADFPTRTFRFTGGVAGRYVPDGEP
jgi:LPS export ABC transporter protein LptC